MGVKLKQWAASNDWTMYGILASIFLVWRIGVTGNWSIECFILLLICLMGVRRDQIDVDWKRFFVVGIPLLGIFYYFYGSGNGLWWKIANWMFENNRHPWQWDSMMNSIPLNNAAWARAFNTPTLDRIFAWIYNYGFVLSLWICLIRSYWTKSIKKMMSYALSGHLLQFPLILLFYNLILLREVWWVKGQPDLLHRHFATENDMLVNVMNCFPSMHTSISFAMLLLALREKDRIFKYMMVTYCAAIIYSTMYLQIHWVLDVIAGMVFAYLTVKLSDVLIHSAAKFVPSRFKGFYNRKQEAYSKETIAA
ncbi:phosphatase PAP2 family protein [Paenibacillus filicis]|uniref:Phosphatase PAP2 family protein n=1 Tax=Paenibacillus gyeongsangnamensis TaxID=3388067 RepID=A0ABT4Q7U0_9BACL|nr:phosphatase PAP2 family protein [Paenibacillus filicis]MCZ8512934.1 phosphatase PAP2 family protein [Paenibacillus filicis]